MPAETAPKLGGQVAETDVDIRLDCLAVSLFLPNSAGVAFAEETRESRMSVCVSKRVVFAALQRRCRNHFDIGGFSLRPPETTRQKPRKKASVFSGFRHHTRRRRSLNPFAGS